MVGQVESLLKPETMTRPEEDSAAGSSVDVVGGGEFSGYAAWKTNQDVSGTLGKGKAIDVDAKSKL